MRGVVMKSATIPLRHRQRGAVTLIITLLIMIAMTVGSFALLQTGTVEKRMTANDQRARDAMQAAQAGVDFVLAHLGAPSVDVPVLCNPARWAEDGFELDFLGFDPVSGEISFDTSDQQAVCESTPFGLLSQINVWSRGYSQDGEGVRTLASTIDMTSAWEWGYGPQPTGTLPGGSGAVIAAGGVRFWGNSDTGVCADKDACDALAQPGASERDNREIPDGPLIYSGSSVQIGGSVDDTIQYVENDPSLQAPPLTADELFSRFIQKPAGFTGTWNIDAFKNLATTFSGSSPGQSGPSLADVADGNPNVYVNGPLALTGGTIGSFDKPVTLVIDGGNDLSMFAGNAVIYGNVFVTGDANFNRGTTKIIGSLITMGQVDNNGNASVYYNAGIAGTPVPEYDPDLIAQPSVRVVSLRVGSWREVVD